MELTVPSGLSDWVWSTGSSEPSIYIDEPTNVYLFASGTDNCILVSDTIDVQLIQIANQPTVSYDSALSTQSGYSTYQWYQNGVAVVGEEDSIFPTNVPGWYFVEVTDGLGCIGVSDSIEISLVTSVSLPNGNELKVYPNPVENTINVSSLLADDFEVLLHNSYGQLLVYEKFSGTGCQIDVTEFASGFYLLSVIDKSTHREVFKVLKK